MRTSSDQQIENRNYSIFPSSWNANNVSVKASKNNAINIYFDAVFEKFGWAQVWWRFKDMFKGLKIFFAYIRWHINIIRSWFDEGIPFDVVIYQRYSAGCLEIPSCLEPIRKARTKLPNMLPNLYIIYDIQTLFSVIKKRPTPRPHLEGGGGKIFHAAFGGTARFTGLTFSIFDLCYSYFINQIYW